jgi:hypothetical protein
MGIALLLLASSCATFPLSSDVENEVRAAIERVLPAYPELRDKPITIRGFEETAVFFASNFAPCSVFGELQYEIHVNPQAFALGLRGEALDGVIAHELGHTLDYETRSLVDVGAHVLFDEQSFERRTDLIAIDRGYGRQLLAYRIWQFGVLTQEQVAQKKRIYYGPLEMTLLLDVKARCPEDFRELSVRPPRSAREIVSRDRRLECRRH